MRRWLARMGWTKVAIVLAIFLASVIGLVYSATFSRTIDPKFIVGFKDPEYLAQARAARSGEIDALIGWEAAHLCLRDDSFSKIDASCVDPIVVSLLCDMSQIMACQTLAKAIRGSREMYLLYPFEVDRRILSVSADYTIFVSNIPGEDSHDLSIFAGHLFADKNGEIKNLREVGRYNTGYDFNKNSRKSSSFKEGM